MKQKLSAPLLAAICAGVFVVLLAVAYLFASGMLHERDTGIILPNQVQSAPAVSAGSQLLTAQSVADVEIGPENAQQVIASLSRPAAYSCRIDNTLYYSGGSSTLTCVQYVKDGFVRTDTLNADGSTQSTLLRSGDAVYAWDSGAAAAYEGNWGDFTDDAAAMLPTYEDVLAQPSLTDAGRENLDEEPCIRVEFEQDEFRCIYRVSASSGLLKTASFYSGDTLVRQTTVSELKTEAPEDEIFTLPDGHTVLGENN